MSRAIRVLNEDIIIQYSIVYFDGQHNSLIGTDSLMGDSFHREGPILQQGRGLELGVYGGISKFTIIQLQVVILA
jgi:hypothetical protein